MVPGRANPNHDVAPGMRYSDIGLRQDKSGSWSVQIDRSGVTDIQNFEGALTAEVARMKFKAITAAKGGQILGETTSGTKKVIRLRAPVGTQFKIAT
jgi:hypothetical protein